MTRTFIETPIFTRNWRELNLDDDSLAELQKILLENPKAGVSVAGTGGMRKIRVPCNGHGRRGGARVVYVDIEKKEMIYLINIYSKNEKDDLSENEKRAVAALIHILKEAE